MDIKINRVDPFEIFMATIAGQKIQVEEGGFVLIGYRYKDRIYIIDFYHRSH
jgi:hypothetical protein